MQGPPADFYSDAELAALMADAESDLVERKETFAGEAPNAVRQAICAFANDLPNHRRPGVIFIGVRDDGAPTGLEINDALLLALAHCKTDGNVLPLPTMTVGQRRLAGADVAVVMVAPADSPPVRYRGRIWTRVGPRRALASAQDERILNEKRRHGDTPFDATPARGATLADVDVRRFQYLYLPEAFDADVLARNDRTVEERLAATKMIAHADDPTPTVLGILTLGRKPTDFLPGAYVQFLRLDEGRPEEGAGGAGTAAGELAAREVGFSYPGSEREAVSGVTLTLAQGTTLALVGVNGAGKTRWPSCCWGCTCRAADR